MGLSISIFWMQQDRMLPKICSYVQNYVAMSKEPTVEGKDQAKWSFSKRNYAEQEKRAQAFSNELHECMMSGEDKPQPKSRETFVDEKASHRHDPPHQSSATNTHSGTSTKLTAKQAKRPCPPRKTRRKSFIRVRYS